MNTLNIIPTNQALQFILGGRAMFVLWNQQTDNRFEFKVSADKKRDTTYWVNYNKKLIGVITYGYMLKEFKLLDKEDTLAGKAIQWYLKKLIANKLEAIPDSVVIYHVGCCARCALKLTDPESIVRGFGIVCWNRIQEMASI